MAVQEILDEWRQFIHQHMVDGGKRYALYHTSYRDFLHRKDIIEAAGVTIKNINSMIADQMLRGLVFKE